MEGVGFGLCSSEHKKHDIGNQYQHVFPKNSYKALELLRSRCEEVTMQTQIILRDKDTKWIFRTLAVTWGCINRTFHFVESFVQRFVKRACDLEP